MITPFKRFCFLLIYCSLFCFAVNDYARAQSPAQSRIFLKGVAHYQQGEYDAALEAFNQIIAAGVINGKLFYNLGGVYLKKGDLGKAILWYERAKGLIPNDPDLKFNMDYARSLLKDAREEKKSALVTVLFFWRQLVDQKSVKWIAVGANMCFWIIMALLKIPGVAKRSGTVLKTFQYGALLTALIFTMTAFYDFYGTKNNQYGVILGKKVSIRSGLTENSTELFVLHAGTKVKIEKENREHYRIIFSEDKIGWLKKTDAEII